MVYFIYDLKRVLFSKRMMISLLIGLALIIQYNLMMGMINIGYRNISFIDMFEAIYIYGGVTLFYMIPLIATIPSATSYIYDEENGIKDVVYSSKNKKNYLIAKVSVNGIAGGLAASLPSILIFLSCIFIYKIEPPLRGEYGIGGAFSGIYTNYPVLYCLIYIALAFLSGAAFANISMALSKKIKNKILITVIPVIIFFGSIVLISISGLNAIIKLNPFDIVSPMNSRSGGLSILIVVFILNLIGILCFLNG